MNNNKPRHRLILLFLIIVSFFFLLVSYIPNLYEAAVIDLMPSNRVMLWGEHIYTYDYNVYLSKIRQGMEGRLTVVDKYDNHTDQKGVLLQMLYLLSGKIGAILHLTPPLTFHLLRTILSFIFVLTIIYLNIYFFKKPSLFIPSTLLSLLAASWPLFYPYQGEIWMGYHMGWWQEMDVLRRISYIPHYTLNYIIICALTLLLYIFSKNIGNNIKKAKTPVLSDLGRAHPERAKRVEGEQAHRAKNAVSSFLNKYFLFICVLLFLSFFIHPSGGLLFLLSWSIYFFIKVILWREYNLKQIIKIAIYTIILFAIAAFPLLYIKSVTLTYPWKTLVDFDMNYHLPFVLKEYLLALGPVFFLGVPGIILALFKKNSKMLVFATWASGAFLGMFLFKLFPYQSEVRFVQTANHIPLAILSVYFLSLLIKRLPNLFIKFITVIIFITIILLGLVQSYFSIKSQTDFIHQRAVAVNPPVPYPSQVMYPLKDFYNAIEWLGKNTKTDQVVLSKITAGNYIPAYAGNFVYLGHNPETPHYTERVEKVNLFFSGTMNAQNALNFLKSQNISYVFYSPQEKDNAQKDMKQYPFLKEVFNSTYVTIYKLRS